MKRVSALLFVLSLLVGVIALSACGETPVTPTEADTTAATTAATTATEAATAEQTVATTVATTEATKEPTIVVEGDHLPDEPLPDALMCEIEKYYDAKPNYGDFYHHGVHGFPHPYYGTYEGYVIFVVEGNLCMYFDETIAGEQFTHHQLIMIAAYKDGEFTELDDLYAEGKISDEAVKKIAAVHREYNEVEWYLLHDYLDVMPEELEKPVLDDETVQAIKDAWADGESVPENIIPYGKYGDCCVFSLDTSMRYYTDKAFGEYVFRVYSPNVIYVYRDGEILTLEAAFDGGYLSEGDIETISYYNADRLLFHKIFERIYL